MSVKERLIEYIKFKRISARKFSISIGVSPGYVNSISKSIQPDKLNRITVQYPDLNPEWLLTGEGEMLKAETVNTAHPIIYSARDSDDRFDRLMKIVEMQSKQMEVQSKQIEMLLNKIDRLEKQENGESPRPNEASDHT